MSDIYKDFEEWMVKQALAFPSWLEEKTIGDGTVVYCDHDGIQRYWVGYQAGRAHDADGLIAEIEKCPAVIPEGFSSLLLYREDVIEIIRKHFGKE